jgi:hypothetical protein
MYEFALYRCLAFHRTFWLKLSLLVKISCFAVTTSGYINKFCMLDFILSSLTPTVINFSICSHYPLKMLVLLLEFIILRAAFGMLIGPSFKGSRSAAVFDVNRFE